MFIGVLQQTQEIKDFGTKLKQSKILAINPLRLSCSEVLTSRTNLNKRVKRNSALDLGNHHYHSTEPTESFVDWFTEETTTLNEAFCGKIQVNFH